MARDEKRDVNKRGGGANWTLNLYRLAFHVAVIALFFGFLGHVLPQGDSLAVFRPEFTLLVALGGVIGFFLRRRLIPAVAVVSVSVSLWSLWPHVDTNTVNLDEDDPGVYTLHQHNLLLSNQLIDRFVWQIRRSWPDVMTLQEVGRHRKMLLDFFGSRYPNYQFCDYSYGSVGVMVRDIGPRLASGCAQKAEMAWIQIMTEDGPVTFASIHLFWPWPMGQFGQRAILGPDLEALPRPVVLGGDFNNVPWSAIVDSLSDAADVDLLPGVTPSFSIGGIWPRLRLDHVAIPPDAEGEAEVVARGGSDHNGIVARFRLSPARK